MTFALLLVILYLLLATFWLRKKALFLQPVPPSDTPAALKIRLIGPKGGALHAKERDAVAMFMQQRHLTLLDLWPQRIPAPLALASLAQVMTNKMPDEIFAPGGSAGALLAISEELSSKNTLYTDDAAMCCDYAGMSRLVAHLKPCASRAALSAILPGLSAPKVAFASFRQGMKEKNEDLFYPYLLANMAMFCLIFIGLWRASYAALFALCLFSLQPVLVFAGGKLNPQGLWVYAILRIFWDTWSTLALIFGALCHRERKAKAAVLREEYRSLLAQGVQKFLGPRALSCPLCQSGDAATFLVSGEYQQGKPGRFTLDICKVCGHIWQNPQLTGEGLDFYYKDFYSGLGRQRAEFAFGFDLPKYFARARIVAKRAAPALWLDVGFGQGHFCQIARGVLPDTQFHGVDMNDNVAEALRRGWIDKGYTGMFPAIATELLDRYDVVSMHHYLEHTVDIHAEIKAAYAVLVKGGLFVLELPNPRCLMSRLLGGFSLIWFQPQHLHLVNAQNAEKLLTDAGFTLLEREARACHQHHELVLALLNLFHRLAPSPYLPWHEGGCFSVIRHGVVALLFIPLMPVALLVNHIYDRLLLDDDWSNTFRILAQKQ